MAENLNDDLEYVVEDYFDMGEFHVEFEMNGHQREGHDADLVEDEDPTKQKNDTSASEYRKGKDIQGIPWERLNHSREKYREIMLKLYKNYQNLRSQDEFEKECKQVERSCTFYDFQFNTRLVKPTIVHFRHLHHQASLFSRKLRDLLWATSKHDVYLMQNYSVMHWSSLLRRGKEVLNVAEEHPGSLAQSLSRVQISTMVVKDNLMAAGGFQGELFCKYLNQPGVAFCTKITADASAITNAVDIYQSPNGSNRVMTANNDCCVRVFDTEKFVLLNCLSFSWSVNSTSVSPDGKLLAILGTV